MALAEDRTLLPAEQLATPDTALEVVDDTTNPARAFAHRRRFVRR